MAVRIEEIGRREMWPSAGHGEPSHNLLRHRVCPRGDLLRRLVLYRMLHVNGVKASASQRARLHSRRSGELSGGNRHCGNSQIF